MSVGDVLLVRDEQMYGTSVQVINQYFYECTTAGLDAPESGSIAEAFVAQLLPDILSIQTSNMTHTRISVRNLNNPLDFSDLPLLSGNVGAIAQEPLPPFAAWSFMYQRGSLAVRNGWKRICGVPTGEETNGVANAGFLDDLAAAASAMAANLTEPDGTGVYVPRIARLTYVLGELDDVQLFPIVGVVYRAIGTQNSRKYGRGS